MIRLRVGLTLLAASALAAGALTMFQPTQTLEAAPVGLSVPGGLHPNELGQWCQERQAAGTAGLSYSAVRWLRSCVELFGGDHQPSPSSSAGTAPTPDASSTTTPTPSGAASASPTPTTAPPTTRPPTTAPAPGPVALGCMPQPSACGWPDETNTGVPAGTPLTLRSGDLHITQTGTYSNLDITGCVYIEASNVVIKNSRIRGECWYSIRTFGAGNPTGLVVEDTEIVLARGLEGSYGICCSNYTLTRVYIHANPGGNQGADCVYLNSNNVVQDSYCVVGPLNAGSAGHADGFQSDGGSNYTLDHNTIRNPNSQTSAILMSTNSGPISNVRIRNNLVAGGGYTIYCGTDSGGLSSGLTFSGNRFARTYFSKSGYYGPTTSCGGSGGGNIWDDNGQALS